MMKQEKWSRVILVGALALVAGLAGYAWYSQSRILTLRALIPEQGGWMPGELSTAVGEPLQLRLVSEDVTHSFAIGQMDLPPVDLYPGEVQNITLTFDQPGKYTYYCTRWCGPNHWRMRGTIEVTGEGPTQAELAVEKPLYIELGLDIDAPHPAQLTPDYKPSSQEINPPIGNPIASPLNLIPGALRSQSYYRSHSPFEAWQGLRAEPKLKGLDDNLIWSLVAILWQDNTTADQLAAGKALYAANCAACHGEDGSGNGVFSGFVENGEVGDDMQIDEHSRQSPADFTDPTKILGASPALLHGKIVRGGMGTGMPYWGPIFTEDQVWSLVSYLWTYQFNYAEEQQP